MGAINKFSSVPLYCQLKDIILRKIESGEFKENDKIPSEHEFCEKYGISRPTVRQAVNELTNNGYLYKLKGRGTFVSKRKTSIHVKDYSGFTDSILDGEDLDKKSIISTKTLCVDDYNKLLNIFELNNSSGEMFAEITYLNLEGEDVLSLNVSYISMAHFPEIIKDVEDKKSPYEILRGKYPFVPVKSRSSLEIVYTNQKEAAHLQVQPGQALIKIESILFSKSGQVVEYVVSKYRADKCKFMFEKKK